MSTMVETVLFVFGLVALGYLTGVTGYLTSETGDALSAFALGLAMPLLLFRTMAQADFDTGIPWAFWGVYFCAVIAAWTAGHLVTTLIFGRDHQAGVVGGVSAAFSNLVLLGLPFMRGVYGQQGSDTLSLLISVHLPVMIMASIILFGIFGRNRENPPTFSAMATDFVRRVTRNPLIVGILLGLVWRLAGLPLPDVAARLVDAFADVGGTLALFAMGLGLRKFGIHGHVAPALALSALKLILMPAVALLAAWAFGLPPLTAKVAVVAAALPSGVNSYLIAVQFGTGQALASNQMTIATALAALTTTFWLTVAERVFG